MTRKCQFCNSKLSKNNYMGICKKNSFCKKEYNSTYRKNNLKKYSDLQKKYREINKTQYLEYRRLYYTKNKSKILEQEKIDYLKNSDKVKESVKKYYLKNKNKVIKQKKEYIKKRAEKDIVFALRRRLGSLIRICLKNKNINKKSKTRDILGADYNTVMNHLINTAIKNYGFYTNNIQDYHIDHIVPISLAKNEEDVIRLNHYKNLQLLKPLDNLIKSNKVL